MIVFITHCINNVMKWSQISSRLIRLLVWRVVMVHITGDVMLSLHYCHCIIVTIISSFCLAVSVLRQWFGSPVHASVYFSLKWVDSNDKRVPHIRWKMCKRNTYTNVISNPFTRLRWRRTLLREVMKLLVYFMWRLVWDSSCDGPFSSRWILSRLS